MNNFPKLLLAVVFGASVSLVADADWNSNLQGGGVVNVDPDTLRATVTRDGVTTPLWNGVHRMQDGSALIVNHGGAVPGAPASSPPRQLPAPESEDWEGAPIAGYSPCEQLARHVCGMQGECATAEACNPSRQLLAMEDEERRQAVDRSRMTYTSGQCIQARADETYFSACRTGK